ncbi:MAG: hypothetical protein ABIP13_02395, partial [Tepidiformaceae bacterium]
MRTLSIRASMLAVMVIGLLLSGVATGYASHSWGTYHWARTENPFTLRLGNNMTTFEWTGYLKSAAGDWNSTNGANPLRTVLVAGAGKKRCGAVSGRVEVCNGTYGQNGWLGLAQIWLSNGHIVQGTTKMNDSYFSQAYYNNANEKLHVVCQ